MTSGAFGFDRPAPAVSVLRLGMGDVRVCHVGNLYKYSEGNEQVCLADLRGNRALSSMKTMRPTLRILAVSAVILGVFSAPASAESLQEALSRAYLFNPTLKASRAQLRATDEEVARAKSGFRPTINGQVSRTFQNINTSPNSPANEGNFLSNDYSVTLNQPIFQRLPHHQCGEGRRGAGRGRPRRSAQLRAGRAGECRHRPM